MDFAPWAEHLAEWAGRRRLNVVLADSLASTNQLGLDVLRSLPEREPTGWIFALHQRSGQGRLGRRWVSPRGAGVYASRMLHLPSAVVALLPLVVGAALCEGLAVAGYRCRLKWPNDLLLGGSKVGGILLHGRLGAARAAVVAGFGVNRGHTRAELPRADATSLRLAAPPPPPELAALAATLADSVDHELDRWGAREAWRAEGVAARYAAWCAHSPGDDLTVTTGAETVRGTFLGVGADGRLRLATAAGEVAIAAGDVAEEPG